MCELTWTFLCVLQIENEDQVMGAQRPEDKKKDDQQDLGDNLAHAK